MTEPRPPLRLAWSISLALLLLVPAESRAANGDCGIPFTSGAKPKTSDALFILRSGVGLETCALCVCDANGNGAIASSDALVTLRSAVGQNVNLNCPLPCAASGGCPGVVEWTTQSGSGEDCNDNSDCDVGFCDTAIDRCRTLTDVDLGWTGQGHGSDLNQGATLQVRVECNDDDAPCGVCEVEGIDAAGGSCRCANDTRSKCSNPFETNAIDCPACEAGAFVGFPCASNVDCDAGACSRRCEADLSILCGNSSDCPSGACIATTSCSNGKSCQVLADCTGTCTVASACNCYDGPPLPVSAGGTSLCIVQRLTSDLSGSVNVDTGSGSLDTSVRLLLYLGLSTTAPCPICGGRCSNDSGQTCVTDSDCDEGADCDGDALPQDGVRGGICIGGASSGLSCDVDAENTSFANDPSGRSGAGTSLDCLPATGAITGAAQPLAVSFSTTDAQLDADLSCGGQNPGAFCPCLMCSADPTLACRSDADCSSQPGACSASALTACDSNSDCLGVDAGTCLPAKVCQRASNVACNKDADCDSVDVGTCNPATCSAAGVAGFPAPNQCDGGLCSNAGAGEGECTSGPDDKFCDAVVKANGEGIYPCADDAACAASSAGSCTLVHRRRCFLDPIVAPGDADPRDPAMAAALCMAPTTHAGVNTLLGLPGPGRWIRQMSQRSFCESDPGRQYRPGTGGCP